MADLVSDLEAVEDPVDRFKRASKLLEAWPDQQSRISDMRREVVLSLRRDKVSYRKIAALLGMSLVRIQQIEKGLSAGPNKAKKKTADDEQSDTRATGLQSSE